MRSECRRSTDMWREDDPKSWYTYTVGINGAECSNKIDNYRRLSISNRTTPIRNSVVVF